MRPAAGATGRVFKSGKMIPMKTLPSSVPDSGPTSVPTPAPTSVSDSAPAGRVAVVDVGSNASRLLVARGDGSGDGLAVEMFARVPLRLGAGAFVDGGGEIPAEGVRKLALVLRGFRNIIAAQAPDVSGAFATAALREAVNGKEVAQLMARRAGVAIEILSGRREAGVVGKFVAAQFPDARAMVCADVGGGSSDFVFAQNGTVKSAASFRVGTARPDDDKTAREFVRMEQWLSHLPSHPPHPPTPSDQPNPGSRSGLQPESESNPVPGSGLQPESECNPVPGSGLQTKRGQPIPESECNPVSGSGLLAVVVGGGAAQMAGLCNGLTSRNLESWRKKLQALSPQTVAARFNIEPDRAESAAAAITIYQAVLRASGANELKVARGGLPQALAAEMLTTLRNKSRSRKTKPGNNDDDGRRV